MHRAVELEIRLSYYDRILRVLPEAMQASDAGVMPEEAPGPDFEYDDPGSLSSYIRVMKGELTPTILQQDRTTTLRSLC